MCLWLLKTLSLDRIVKGIEILILKGFDIVYVYVKSMVKKWCDILVIYKQ
jgi:hypothetical protein